LQKVWAYLQTLLRSAPRKLPISLKQRKITAVTPLKVIQGHRFWYHQLKAHIRLPILKIYNNLSPILHRFRCIAFDRSILLSLLGLTPPTEGCRGTISIKFSVNISGWPRYQMAKKHS